jgi:PAS domain S-box-containing protein
MASSLDPVLERMLDAIPDAAVVFRSMGPVVACNDRACAALEYSREEFLKLTPADLASRDRARDVAAKKELAATGRVRGAVTLLKRGGGQVEGDAWAMMLPEVDGTSHVLAVWRELVDTERSDASTTALQESNELLRALSDASFEAVFVHRDGIILSANRAAERIYRVAPGGLVGRSAFDFTAPESVELVLARVRAGDETPYEGFALRADGSTFPAEVQGRKGPMVGGAPVRVVCIRDLSARRDLESQLRQAQKMEAIGRLAGGVAHDFNNILSVILSFTELAYDRLPPESPIRDDLSEIRMAAQRAADLTKQMLAFSRRQVLSLTLVSVNDVVKGMATMIQRLIGEDLELVVSLAPAAPLVSADRGQLEQVVMNLVVNARDAMPGGGRLFIETDDVFFDDTYAAEHVGAKVGPHAMIAVTDTGVGMDTATRARIFEPFFTTKAPGRGTGLGLATVFGIVQQSGGNVWVYSELGRGTVVKVYLPVAVGTATRTESAPTPKIARGGETILVVEDYDRLREVTVRILQEAGYEVWSAADAPTAIEVARSNSGAIDLLLTDVILPGMNGQKLAEQLAASRPSVRTLFMSGYTETGVLRTDLLAQGVNFVEKPITPETLLAAVRRALDR